MKIPFWFEWSKLKSIAYNQTIQGIKHPVYEVWPISEFKYSSIRIKML